MITYSKIAVGNVQRCMCYGKKHIRDSNLLPFKTQNNYGDKLIIIKIEQRKTNYIEQRKRSNRSGASETIWQMSMHQKNQMVRTIDLQASAPKQQSENFHQKNKQQSERAFRVIHKGDDGFGFSHPIDLP